MMKGCEMVVEEFRLVKKCAVGSLVLPQNPEAKKWELELQNDATPSMKFLGMGIFDSTKVYF